MTGEPLTFVSLRLEIRRLNEALSRMEQLDVQLG